MAQLPLNVQSIVELNHLLLGQTCPESSQSGWSQSYLLSLSVGVRLVSFISDNLDRVAAVIEKPIRQQWTRKTSFDQDDLEWCHYSGKGRIFSGISFLESLESTYSYETEVWNLFGYAGNQPPSPIIYPQSPPNIFQVVNVKCPSPHCRACNGHWRAKRLLVRGPVRSVQLLPSNDHSISTIKLTILQLLDGFKLG